MVWCDLWSLMCLQSAEDENIFAWGVLIQYFHSGHSVQLTQQIRQQKGHVCSSDFKKMFPS